MGGSPFASSVVFDISKNILWHCRQCIRTDALPYNQRIGYVIALLQQRTAIIGRVKRNNVPVMPPRVRSPFRNMIVHTLSGNAQQLHFEYQCGESRNRPAGACAYPTVYGM